MSAGLKSIDNLKYSDENSFLLIAGPCAIEGRDMAFRIAEKIAETTDRLRIPWIFKGSYRKANRSKLDSFHGIGDEKALNILRDVGAEFEVPVVTDIHADEEAAMAANFVDVLQIPAFLCRQTSLLQAAAETGKWVNIKKGQFMSPESMKFAVDKVKSSGNNRIMLTERGTFFGYGDLVVDFRSFSTMNTMTPLTVMDCTHSLQQPNQSSGVTGGQPELIRVMARTGLAAGAKSLFIETHHDPKTALSDGKNMLLLDKLEPILKESLSVYQIVNPSP